MAEEKERKKWFKDYQRVASLNTVFSLFFNLLPFWVGVLVTISAGKWTGWSKFYINGEFYLYSTSLISSAYLIYYNNKLKSADIYSFFTLASLMLIVVTAILYATLTTSRDPHQLWFIKWASIIAILLAIPLFLHSQIVSNKKSPDVGEQRREEQGEIMDSLN